MSWLSRFNLRNLRLATQLTILLVVMALVPLILVTLYNDTIHRGELLQAARERNQLQARNAAAEIDEYLDDTLADVRVLAVMPAAVGLLRDEKNAAARNELSLLFHETREAHDYAIVMLVDQTGTVILSTTPSAVGQSYVTAPTFQSAVGGNVAFDEPRYDPFEDEVFLHFSAPVRNIDGTIMGAIISRISMMTFDDLARSRATFESTEHFGLLWTDAGILLSDTAHPDWRFRPLGTLPADVSNKMIAEARYGPLSRARLTSPLGAPSVVERGREMLYDPQADPYVRVSFGDVDMVQGVIAPLHNKRWLYGVFISERVVLEELDAQTQRILQTAVLVGVLALLSGILGARWWIQPLQRVTETARALAAGDLTRRVRLTGRDEVGQLAVNFNAMAEVVAEKDRQLREYAATLEARVNERTLALSESEERYRSLIQVSPDAISMIAVDGSIVFCNHQLAQLHGYVRAEEMIGLNILDLVMPQDRPKLIQASRNLRDTGRTGTEELELLRKDGSGIPAEIRWSVIPATATSNPVTICVTHDISERMQAEAEIRRHAAYQIALNAVITLAVKSGNSLDVMLNATLDEIVRAVQVPMAGVWVQESSNRMRAFAMRGLSAAVDQIMRHQPLFENINKSDLAVVADWTLVKNNYTAGMLAMGIRASVLVPLFVDGKAIGGIAIAMPEPREWTHEEITFIRTIAYQLGILIERVRLFDDALVRAEQFSLLYQAGLAVNRSLDVREQMRYLCQTAMQSVHAERTVVFLYDPSTNELRYEFGIGANLDASEKKDSVFGVGQESSIIGMVGQTRQMYYLPDVTRDSRWIEGPIPVRSALWIPLTHEQTLQGVIVVMSPVQDAFDAQAQILMSLFASQISIAMENARLYENALRAAERRSILHQASQDVITAGMDLERMYQAIHHAAASLMPCEAFVIGLYDEVRAENVAVYLVDRDERFETVRSPAEYGLMGQVIPTGQAVLINELPQVDHYVHFGDAKRVRSVLAVPMRSGSRTIGMLSAQSYQAHAYTSDDQVLLDMLAANASSVLENARLFQETRRRLAALESLSRVSASLRTAQTLEQMTGMLLDETLAVLKAHAATVWLYDAGKNLLYLAAARGFPSDAVPLRPGEGITGQVFASGQVYISPNFHADPHTSEANRPIVPNGLRGAVVPIRTAQESIGVLFVSVQEPEYLDQDQVHLLTTLAEMAGNAIHRQRLHSQTQHRLEQVEALRTVDMAITSSMDLNVTLNILLERTATQLGMAGADILIFNAPLRTLEYAAGFGLRAREGADMHVRLGEKLAGTVALERRSVTIADVSTYLVVQKTTPVGASHSADLEFADKVQAYVAVPLVAKGELKGVLELFHTAPRNLEAEGVNFLEAIANQAAIAIDNTQLFHNLERSNIELALAYDTTIEGWSRTLDLRDEETEVHTQRVTEMTVRLARAMGLSDAELVNVRRGALLHDIGKMGVPDQILLKPGPLSEAEWKQMRRHPLYAYQLLAPIKFLGTAIDIPYNHHEYWDGTGYPRGLKGEQIPLTARIFTVVDVWDALTSSRPYRPQAWTHERTCAYIQSMSGKQFDPQVVQVFLRMLAE